MVSRVIVVRNIMVIQCLWIGRNRVGRVMGIFANVVVIDCFFFMLIRIVIVI